MTATYANITETNVFTALRSFILVYVDCEVIRTPVNRAAMPKNDFIAMSPVHSEPLETNTHAYTETEETITRPTQLSIQIDSYGSRAFDRIHALTTLWRDEIACQALSASGVQPLYASAPTQLPLITGEEQYLERWTSLFEMQINPALTLAIETADTLTTGLINVDRVYPPGA